MIMKIFEVLVTSVPDRENLVAEIWHDNKLIAEINSETGVQEIIFYCEKETAFDYQELINALKEASLKLKEEVI